MSETFKDYVVGQLKHVGAVRTRPMFRDYGLYVYDDLFGIISDEQLYFRTDRLSYGKYVRFGMHPYDTDDQLLKNFYEVPLHILRSRRAIARWAREATLIRAQEENPVTRDYI